MTKVCKLKSRFHSQKVSTRVMKIESLCLVGLQIWKISRQSVRRDVSSDPSKFGLGEIHSGTTRGQVRAPGTFSVGVF